jgi:hypothetical protein
MVWQQSIGGVLVIAFCILIERRVDSFPTGAGSCKEGPAVGGVHLEASTVLRPTDLGAGKFDVLVDGRSLIHGQFPHVFASDHFLTVDVVSELHLFKGALLRVSRSTGSMSNSDPGAVSFVFEAGKNSGPAFACDVFNEVVGISHTDGTEKRSIGGLLRVAPEMDRIRLDVTVVVATNAVLSIFFHQHFYLQFSTPLPAPVSTLSTTNAPIPHPTVATLETAQPSYPTLYPTQKSPSNLFPTQSPNISTTSRPTASAVNSVEEPTEIGTTSISVNNIQIDLLNVTSMSFDESIRWESLTTIWFESYYEPKGPVRVKSTSILMQSSTPLELGDTSYALRVVYDQRLEYYTVAENDRIHLTPKELVVLPFQSPEWNAAYIELLRSDPRFLPRLVSLGGPIGVPIVGDSQQADIGSSRKLSNGLIWLVVALPFVVVAYASYRLLEENRGGLKVPDFAPDTFSFIGSETSRRFGGNT